MIPGAESGAAALAVGKRARGQRGVEPLSGATRRRMLAALMRRAEAGDGAAAEALVRLSLTREGMAGQAAASRRGACGRCGCLSAGKE